MIGTDECGSEYGPATVPAADESHEAERQPPGERVTLRIPFHLTKPLTKPPRRTAVRKKPTPAGPNGRIPQVSRTLAQAHHFQNLLDTGVVRTQTELAKLTMLTTARISQIMNLLVLAPDIQEQILFLPPVTKGPAPVTEKKLRPLLKTLVWSEQREMWAAIQDESQACQDMTP